MKKYRVFFRMLYTLMFIFSANSFHFVKLFSGLWWCPVLAFLLSNLLLGCFDLKIKNARLAICNHGWLTLTAFSLSVIVSAVYHIALIISPLSWGWSMLVCYLAHLIFFWNGIVCVYCTSVQLGIKQRIIGAICGPIPIAHLFALRSIIKITKKEVIFESEKLVINQNRKYLELCKTKYPIVLVHGVFFRDSKYFNYWGRVSSELIKNGAVIYYGEHQSALSTSESGKELAERIKDIVRESGCGKVNIIAHSKGGLDCREAIANWGIGELVASLTTVSTPHRGCYFAEHLLDKLPEDIKNKAALIYNNGAKRLGDSNPDFLAAVNDLKPSVCQPKDKEFGIPEGIYCQSVGSIQKKAASGRFPVNISYRFVKKYDGENDGLVSEESFRWGEKYTLVKPKGDRGISHADMIDLNRENIEGFDVREFYVELVNDLKKRGF